MTWHISRLINICVDEQRIVLNRFTEEEREYLLGFGPCMGCLWHMLGVCLPFCGGGSKI